MTVATGLLLLVGVVAFALSSGRVALSPVLVGVTVVVVASLLALRWVLGRPGAAGELGGRAGFGSVGADLADGGVGSKSGATADTAFPPSAAPPRSRSRSRVELALRHATRTPASRSTPAASAAAAAFELLASAESGGAFLRRCGWARWCACVRGNTAPAAVAVTAFVTGAVALQLPVEGLLLLLILCAGAGVFCKVDGSRSLGRSALLSVVVVVFALPAVEQGYRFGLIVAVVAAGASWLVIRGLADSGGQLAGGRSACVYGGAVVLMLVGTCFAGRALLAPTDGQPWYGSWMPTSGGDGAGDARATRGVGDGPDELAGQSADSVGFDKGDVFSEHGGDGLYDLWVESYGEPITSRDTQKMIGLKRKDVNVVASVDREDLRIGRSFETHRRPTRLPRAAGPNASAGAAVWIKGPAPAYVPLAIFTDFDGDAWHAFDAGRRDVPVRKLNDTGWMQLLNRPLSPAYAGVSEYELRLGTLGGSVLPLPRGARQFKMGRADRPSFFASTASGFVRLANRSLPPGTVINVDCSRMTPSVLDEIPPANARQSAANLIDATHVDERVRSLACAWGAGQSRGWGQVEQVLVRLRQAVRVDPMATVDAGANAVDQLLFATRRGPDHQIAGAAVMLLRSLDYPTRLVSGLYGDATKVDPRTGFAPLDARDTHFWIEVRMADGYWIPLDPTPGYPIFNLPKPASAWVEGAWIEARQVVVRHAEAVAVALVGLAALVVARRQVIDRVATGACLLRGSTPLQVLRVVELRAKLLGRPRPKSEPVGIWLRSLGGEADIARLAREIDRVLYAGVRVPCEGYALGASSGRLPAVSCGRNVLITLTLRKLRGTT